MFKGVVRAEFIEIVGVILITSFDPGSSSGKVGAYVISKEILSGFLPTLAYMWLLGQAFCGIVKAISLHAASGATELTEGDLATVLNEIYEARVHAYYVGLNLKVPTDVLESIESQYSDDRRRLHHVIKEFLKRTDPKPTWRAIVDALKSPTVDMAKLAEKVEVKFCLPPKPDNGKGMQLVLGNHIN